MALHLYTPHRLRVLTWTTIALVMYNQYTCAIRVSGAFHTGRSRLVVVEMQTRAWKTKHIYGKIIKTNTIVSVEIIVIILNILLTNISARTTTNVRFNVTQ